jgi:hypothetical protein
MRIDSPFQQRGTAAQAAAESAAGLAVAKAAPSGQKPASFYQVWPHQIRGNFVAFRNVPGPIASAGEAALV